MNDGLAVTGSEYASIQAFYSWQWQLSDQGRIDEYVSTFTEDAEQTVEGRTPAVGRAGLLEHMQRVVASPGRSESFIQHHMDMLVVRALGGDVLHARGYLTTFVTSESEPRLLVKAVLEDELLRDGDSFLIRRRVMKHLALSTSRPT
jgi:hypothetical protein